MKLTHDLHTHSTFSHGKNSITEMVEQARKLHIPRITISDHGRNHPFFGLNPKELKDARTEVDMLNRKYDDIEVFLGVEANIIGSDGAIDIYDEEHKYCDSFYAGYHYGFLPDNFSNFTTFFIPNVSGQFIPGIRQSMKARNTESYIKMIERYPELSLITHPGDKIPIEIEPVAEAAAAHDVLLEINQHHNRLNLEDLIKSSKYPVKYAVASDAHHVSEVGKVGTTEALIRAAGIHPDRIVNVEFD